MQRHLDPSGGCVPRHIGQGFTRNLEDRLGPVWAESPVYSYSNIQLHIDEGVDFEVARQRGKASLQTMLLERVAAEIDDVVTDLPHDGIYLFARVQQPLVCYRGTPLQDVSD